MKRILLSIAITLTAFLSATAQTVVETDIKARFEKNEFVTELSVNSETNQNASVLVELLETNGRIKAKATTESQLVTGQNKVTLRTAFGTLRNVDDLIWKRLRYTVQTDSKTVKGIVSLSEIMSDFFELRAISGSYVQAGSTYAVGITAVNTVSGQYVSNVELVGTLELPEVDEQEEIEVKAESITDSTGFTTLLFQIPVDRKFENYDNAKIRIRGARNGIYSIVTQSIDTIEGAYETLINTDKPLYQPGQMIYVRALATKREQGRNFGKPLPNTSLEFKIEDGDDTTLYRETVSTSKFGIASIKWQIPDNAKLGNFRVRIENIDADETSYAFFKVSRYELPNFIVNPKPDKTYYLPNDKTAKVKVDAKYLFGKPVDKGTVKIVRESDRTWNYKERKWDVEEEESYKGETDKSGSYEAKIDLTAAHKELAADDDNKFGDLQFTAYFTDSTTNLTEERKFDIRISKEDIHVYFVGLNTNDQSGKLPLHFFVTTSLADGSPISVNVKLEGKYKDLPKLKASKNIRTNKYGAAEVELKMPPPPDEVYYEDVFLYAKAKDGKRRGGAVSDEITFDDDENEIRIRADKTIISKGKPIEIEVFSDNSTANVFLNVMSGLSILGTHEIRLQNGYARYSIPYLPQFAGILSVGIASEIDSDEISDSISIIYPSRESLEINAKTEKDTYRPATDVSVEYSIEGPNGNASENALGIYVLDRAVEERAITDSNFSGGLDPFTDYRRALGFGRGFGGVSINDINKLDDSKPIDKDLELATKVMLSGSEFEPEFYDSSISLARYEFGDQIKSDMSLLSLALKYRYGVDFVHPMDEASFLKLLLENGVDFNAMRDPWGMPYEVSFDTSGRNNNIRIKSKGPNKIADNDEDTIRDDDFVPLTLSFEYFIETGRKISAAIHEYEKIAGEFPRDIKTFKHALDAAGIDWEKSFDPWGNPYQVKFDAAENNYTIEIHSGGSSKDRKVTFDDFRLWQISSPYYAKHDAAITRILDAYVKKTNAYPKSDRDFKQILKAGGVDFDSLRDGWGRPFVLTSEITTRFTDRVKIESRSKPGLASEEHYILTPVTQEVIAFSVVSNGEEGEKETRKWQKIRVASYIGVLSEQAKDDSEKKSVVPKSVLANGRSGVYGTISDTNGAVIPGATVTAENVANSGSKSTLSDDKGAFVIGQLPAGNYRLRITAPGFMTQIVSAVFIRAGSLLKIDSSLEVGDVSVVVDVTASVSELVNMTDSAIDTNITRVPGLSTIPVLGSLFKVARGVLSEPSNVGYLTEDARGSETTFVIDGQQVTDFRTGALNRSNSIPQKETNKETPRVRNYFPETLLWAPEIVTDENGKTTVKFTLADNITTWKIYAIASNTEGRIGISEKEIKTFQPFFVDLLPPRVLTKGDEISLPVQVRNYTDKKQMVEVTLRGESWFRVFSPANREPVGNSLVSTTSSGDSIALNIATNMTGRGAASNPVRLDGDEVKSFSPRESVEVDSNSSQNAVFNYRAVKPVEEGVMNVTAVADGESDAIEKPVSVNHDGKEVIESETRIFNENVSFNADFPANALPESSSAHVKIYPNLLAHVAESTSGLLKRPYGCGEQTISSTYPNLMLLKFESKESKLGITAKTYLQKGYERLLGYQSSNGGFTYWGGKDSPDISLTAYALMFLNDAKEFIDVDEDVIKDARRWLAGKQESNGSWDQRYWSGQEDDPIRSWQTSTYVVRALSATRSADEPDDVAVALDTGMLYLAQESKKISEPYALANLGLAFNATNQPEKAKAIADQLRTLAIAEGDGYYWNLETNTPFFGWGKAGRMETTGVVLQLLQATSGEKNTADDKIVSGGLSFLLRNKDRYGVWYSTQATINVLNAILASVEQDSLLVSESGSAGVFVNGEKVQTIELPPSDKPGYPLTADITKHLASGSNKIEVRTDARQTMQAQVVASHFIDWNDFTGAGRQSNASREVALDYKCDKYRAKPTEEVTCQVKAERFGFRGYGMLLAEIGLPPGADVDRASLDRAQKEVSSFSRYDVLPDRIVIYMWAEAGGTSFDFKFKPRYGINAQTPASVLYDYYNEEAKAIVKPHRFVVE